MGMTFIPIMFLYGGFAGGVLSHTLAKSLFGVPIVTFWVTVLGVVLGAIGMFAVFYYSPLPHHNGGWGLPPAKKQKWGFTTEPAGEYEDPTTKEVMKAHLGLIPWNFAKEVNEEDNE